MIGTHMYSDIEVKLCMYGGLQTLRTRFFRAFSKYMRTRFPLDVSRASPATISQEITVQPGSFTIVRRMWLFWTCHWLLALILIQGSALRA